jgi:hypothetical protein
MAVMVVTVMAMSAVMTMTTVMAMPTVVRMATVSVPAVPMGSASLRARKRK